MDERFTALHCRLLFAERRFLFADGGFLSPVARLLFAERSLLYGVFPSPSAKREVLSVAWKSCAGEVRFLSGV